MYMYVFCPKDRNTYCLVKKILHKYPIILMAVWDIYPISQKWDLDMACDMLLYQGIPLTDKPQH